jgi:undecaprenyl diphosphate synthase
VSAAAPLHVAIIMDGNGRWATARGLPRSAGHRQGAVAVGRIVEAAPAFGIGVLTLYAFSADNWRRPRAETLGLMTLFDEYLRNESDRCLEEGVRLSVIGRRDRLPGHLRRGLESTEARTAEGRALHVRLAIDYSARDAIWLAAERLVRQGHATRDEFAACIASGRGEPADAPPVDLLIRTGGEQRLSDFLLWEAAYAELSFTPVAWPDFGPEHLVAAVANFSRRERRFGGLIPSAAAG